MGKEEEAADERRNHKVPEKDLRRSRRVTDGRGTRVRARAATRAETKERKGDAKQGSKRPDLDGLNVEHH